MKWVRGGGRVRDGGNSDDDDGDDSDKLHLLCLEFRIQLLQVEQVSRTTESVLCKMTKAMIVNFGRKQVYHSICILDQSNAGEGSKLCV